MEFIYPFEKLNCWEDAHELAVEIFELVRDFDQSDKYVLKNQLTRAALSISNNLSEGAGRTSHKDQAHFTTISYGSLLEVVNMLMLCKKLKKISELKFANLESKTRRLSAKLCNLKKAQLLKYGKMKDERSKVTKDEG